MFEIDGRIFFLLNIICRKVIKIVSMLLVLLYFLVLSFVNSNKYWCIDLLIKGSYFILIVFIINLEVFFIIEK